MSFYMKALPRADRAGAADSVSSNSLTFQVDDIEAKYQELSGQGVAFDGL